MTRRALAEVVDDATSAEVLEGLSWAAWWVDDAEGVFEAREAAYRLYRRDGDAAGAARMAIWLACDQLDFRGAFAVATGWLRRAHRLLDGLAPRPEHGWLAFQEGYMAHASADSARACELGMRAADIGRQFGVADLEMLGLALEGGALVSCGRVEEGMRCLDEASATALGADAAIPISAAWTFCFLVSACVEVRDYQRAFEWCDRIAEFAERYSSAYMFGFCRTHYGAVHLFRGRWHDAERELEAAVESFSRSRPPFVPEALVWLAELRRRQGRSAEAAQILDQAGSSSSAQLCRGRLALDRGETRRAAALAERCLRQTPAARALDRVPALELLVRARIAGGDDDAAAVALGALRDTARRVGTLPLLASADLAEGMLALSSGESERARTTLEDATDAFERAGLPFEAERARLALAMSLLSLGQLDEAELEARSARDRLRVLGAGLEVERAERLLEAMARDGPGHELHGHMTPRERDVLRLLAEGLTNRQIGERLVVSEHTVHRHVTNILRKLNLPSRTAAAAYAVRAGATSPDLAISPGRTK